MSGSILPLHNTPSWRCAQVKKKHRDKFTFYLYPYLLGTTVSQNCKSLATAGVEKNVPGRINKK
jgi:hypothetical protein